MQNTWNAVDWIASILVIVGGINWGLIGIANYNLVNALFGGTGIEPLIYIVVGLAALYMIYASIKAGSMSTQVTHR